MPIENENHASMNLSADCPRSPRPTPTTLDPFGRGRYVGSDGGSSSAGCGNCAVTTGEPPQKESPPTRAKRLVPVVGLEPTLL